MTRQFSLAAASMKPFPALTRPYFITFLLRPNAALYYQIFSRRAAELIEPRR